MNQVVPYNGSFGLGNLCFSLFSPILQVCWRDQWRLFVFYSFFSPVDLLCGSIDRFVSNHWLIDLLGNEINRRSLIESNYFA